MIIRVKELNLKTARDYMKDWIYKGGEYLHAKS